MSVKYATEEYFGQVKHSSRETMKSPNNQTEMANF